LAAQKFVRDFAIAQYKLAIKKDVEAEEDKLKKLEKEQNDLIKSEEKSNKKINDNQRSIQRANDNIRIANEELKRKDGQISEQKLMVERTVKDENANKGAKKTLKELENDKKKLQKERDGEDKNIDKWNKETREEERNITDMKEQQKLKTVDINKQKETLKAVEQKLNNVK
jgi:chromosome segregation ATPase